AELLARHQAGLVVSHQIAPDETSTPTALQPALAKRLEGPRLTLPTLAERAEDLQSLVLFELAAAGLRSRGEPLGIAPAALRVLTEHTWPGNDLELRAWLRHAAAHAKGPVVTVDDLMASSQHT